MQAGRVQGICTIPVLTAQLFLLHAECLSACVWHGLGKVVAAFTCSPGCDAARRLACSEINQHQSLSINVD